MAIKTRLFYVLVLLAFLLVLASVAIAREDPEAELKRCKHQCRKQRHIGQEEKERCEQKCEDYYRQRKEREGTEDEWHPGHPKEKHLRKCQRQCELQEGQERVECRHECEEKFGGHEGRHEEIGNVEEEEEEEEEETGEEEHNPYFFEDEDFTTRIRTEHGRVDVLEKFTEKSKLLRGIENYRLALLEANPHTFVAPSHWDAEAIIFVIKGHGTISLIHEDRRQSFNVGPGDIVRVPAGTPIYMINRDENEKLRIAKLLVPVNLPGHYEAFYEVGGENPESFFTAFSWDVLEAAFKADRDQLERLFGQQKEGVIMKASKEQIQAMSHREEGGGIWPFGGEPFRGAFNLFNKRPSISNKFGQLYEAHPKEHRRLRDLDVMVSFANITKGSMTAPFFNSKATKIAIVVGGEGYFEMACPHVSSERTSSRGKSSSPSNQKISSRLELWNVFVVPAGHPFVALASENNHLQVLCFEVNAKNNVRNLLAGKRNIVSNMEREAQELAFGNPAREVQQIFENQDLEFFFPGPDRQQEHGRRASY